MPRLSEEVARTAEQVADWIDRSAGPTLAVAIRSWRGHFRRPVRVVLEGVRLVGDELSFKLDLRVRVPVITKSEAGHPPSSPNGKVQSGL